jgi:flagellar hook-associated protein 2
MPISSPGIGSGLDVNGIVSQLVELERRPMKQLEQEKTKLNTRLSSFGLLQSYMANVQSAAGVIARADFWTKSTATSGDPTAVTATALASECRAWQRRSRCRRPSARSPTPPTWARAR